jgi:hypothetical protein
MITWLTKKEIVEAAEEGLLSALQCAWQHWKQLYEASEYELQRAYSEEKVNTTCEFCSLCLHMNKLVKSCNGCPLSRIGHQCSEDGSAFDYASDTFYTLVRVGHIVKRTSEKEHNDWSNWKQAAGFLRDLLEELYFTELEKG